MSTAIEYNESVDNRLSFLAYQTLLEVSTPQGLHASGKDEIYDCFFGRDGAITVCQILDAVSKNTLHKDQKNNLLDICHKTIQNMVRLQGQAVNIESGEQPGKFIHEFRKDKDKYLHLTNPKNPLTKPWYLYSDNTLKNYDSLDSTPLSLIAIYKYWHQTQDTKFLISVLPTVESGLHWVLMYGDRDKDGLVEYELPPERNHGGLSVQSWADSNETLIQNTGLLPKYPIAPIEVQGYVWLALKLWADIYTSLYTNQSDFAQKLSAQANSMKHRFNEAFIISDQTLAYGAQVLDGDKNQIKTITGNPMLLLWSSYIKNGIAECIIEDIYINEFIRRVFMPDMFDKTAGIRTMSALSPTFNAGQDSYHNGSFWPVLNYMVYNGLKKHRYQEEVRLLREATLRPIRHFTSMIELYIKDKKGRYLEFRNSSGQTGCRKQAWTAGGILDMSTDND